MCDLITQGNAIVPLVGHRCCMVIVHDAFIHSCVGGWVQPMHIYGYIIHLQQQYGNELQVPLLVHGTNTPRGRFP